MKALEPSMQSLIAQIHQALARPDPQVGVTRLLTQLTMDLPLSRLDQWEDA